MPIFANIVKPGSVKQKVEKPVEPIQSLQKIHKTHANGKTSSTLERPIRNSSDQEKNKINIKKTSRYLEDLTVKGD